MNTPNPNDRLLKILNASSEKQAAIDQILEGKPQEIDKRPLLVGMKQAAQMLNVSRCTVWRMVNAGRLKKVEILPGSYRLRRADIEAIANGEEVI